MVTEEIPTPKPDSITQVGMESGDDERSYSSSSWTQRRRCVPQVEAVGLLSERFSWAQIILRFISVLYEFGALFFVAWLYAYWRSEPTTRVDVLFPSFFPVILGILMDSYEVVSYLFFNRRRAINPVAVGFDVVLTGVGIFCFLILSMVDRGAGVRRGFWAEDMKNVMIFMIVFSIIHSCFIILAAGGIMRIYFSAKRIQKDAQLARSQAEMVQFNEMRRARELGESRAANIGAGVE